MNREIKFRAWTNRDKCWVGAFAVHLSGLWRESPNNEWIDLSKQDEIVLMQYTGLKDKNGKEIYEGDIVRESSWIDTVVEWKEGMQPYFPYYRDSEEMEVIGNVFENPDFLKSN